MQRCISFHQNLSYVPPDEKWISNDPSLMFNFRRSHSISCSMWVWKWPNFTLLLRASYTVKWYFIIFTAAKLWMHCGWGLQEVPNLFKGKNGHIFTFNLFISLEGLRIAYLRCGFKGHFFLQISPIIHAKKCHWPEFLCTLQVAVLRGLDSLMISRVI